MHEDDDMLGKVVAEVMKQLPVKQLYDDAAAPGAKELGVMFEDLAKTLRLCLAPLQYSAALQDRFGAFIERSVRRIPDENQIPPAPQIIGPVLEGARYEPEGTPIDEMFSQLLSRSMDKKRVEEAHPAYAHLIKQLSSDEARILLLLQHGDYDYIFTEDLNRETNLFVNRQVEQDTLPRNDLDFPNNISFYMNHLDVLGLAKLLQLGHQEPIEFNGVQTGTRVRCRYSLTKLGTAFVSACSSKGA